MSQPVQILTLEALKAKGNYDFPAHEAKVRIYSREYHAWWRAEGSGYTIDVRDAGIYTFEDAWARTYHCGPEKQIEYEILPPEPPPLPVIYPLRGSKAPLDATKTGCECDYCKHWSPLIGHITSELSPERARLLNELVDDWMNISSDLDLARAKLDGSWPGWEAMKDFKPNQDTA